MKIAFYKGRTRFFDRLVQWWTRSPYSHCELIDETQQVGQNTMCMSSSFMDGGVRFKFIVLRPDRWDIIDLPWAQASVAVEWFESHGRQKYDLLGILGFVFRVRENPTRWFCSEACGAALGLTAPWRFSPATLLAAVKLANGGVK